MTKPFFMVYMRGKILIAFLLIVCGILSNSCNSGTEPNVMILPSCLDLGKNFYHDTVSNGEAHYHVLAPNGGETYHLGDTLRVTVAAKDDSEAVAYMVLKSAGKLYKFILPGAPKNKSFNPLSKCDLSFVIPDSINAGLAGANISIISDSVKVMVAKYNSETLFYDYSDQYFKIVK